MMYRKIIKFWGWRKIVTCLYFLVILQLLTFQYFKISLVKELRHTQDFYLYKPRIVNYFNSEINNITGVDAKNNDAGSFMKVQHQTISIQTNNFADSSSRIFDFNYNGTDKLLQSWEKRSKKYCQNKFTGYSNMFIRIQDVTVDPDKIARAGPVGHKKTLGQKESTKFLRMKSGLFVLPCDNVPKYNVAMYKSTSKGHIPLYLRNSIATTTENNKTIASQVDAFTVVVTRYDYANLFHAINDIFNVFLMHVLFHKYPKDTMVIIADDHPRGHITDPVWRRLFGDVKRIRQINNTLVVKDMVWNMYGKFCPLNNYGLDHIPHLSDFRNFVLDKYNINHKPYAECSDRMRVLFIWRRDDLSNHRNSSGKIDRKIKNENEILNHMRNLNSKFDIEGVDLANISFGDQLSLVANADIIVRMHGAGLTHMLFMPDRAGVIELWSFHNPAHNLKPRPMSENIARWKTSTIIKWQNKNKKYNLEDGYTYIPPTIIQTLFNKLLRGMCS